MVFSMRRDSDSDFVLSGLENLSTSSATARSESLSTITESKVQIAAHGPPKDSSSDKQATGYLP